jgi:TetR/AcrR family transcriptional regulator
MQSKYLSADERRQRTVEAVVALAGTRNPSEITTAAIACEMNVTQGALFRHFASKEAIWQAVMEWVADRLLDRIDRAAEQSGSPLSALHAIFMSHIDFVIEHPGVPRMMFGELQRAEATPAKKVAHTLMKRYAERLAHRLEEAKAGGEIQDGTDTQAAAILFIGMIQGLVMQSMLAGDLRAAKTSAPGVIGIYCRGLGAGHGHRELQVCKEPRSNKKKG